MAPYAMRREDDFLEFSKQALSRVSEIAVALGARDKLCIAGCLAAELLIARKAIETTDPNLMPKLHRRIPKLLEDLERVCTWPEPPNYHASILRSVVASKGSYLAMQPAEERIRKGLRNFANVSPYVREQFFKKLKRFSSKAGVMSAENDGRDTKARLDDASPDEYPPHVNTTLYSILRSHLPCTCAPNSGKRTHLARLRLRDDILKIDGCVAFDMLFSSSPTAVGDWKDLQFRVAMKRARVKKSVKYPTDGDGDSAVGGLGSPKASGQKSNPGGQPTKIIPTGGLCSIVREKLRSKICFTVRDSELYQLYDASPLTSEVDGPSISLREVFETKRLSSRMKLVLAYIAARSFWQFYDSPWMETQWTSDSIHFLPETVADDDADPDFYASRPTFAVELEDHGGRRSVEYCSSFGVIFRYPRLLDLCVILLEISRGQSIQIEESESIEANLNETWTMVKRHADRHRNWVDFDYPDYRKAVLSCLNFKPSIEDGGGMEADVFVRREFLYKSVVSPLKKLIDALGFGEDLHIMSPMDSSREPKRLRDMPAPPPLPSQDLDSGRESALAEQWLEGLNDVNKTISKIPPAPGCLRPRPVRIAVLDTGIDGDSVFFSSPVRRARIREWKDWVDNSDMPVDLNGHGSHTVSLVMKVAPRADIYVARIAKDTSTLRNSTEFIAEAIRWAASDQVQADIISMSFGFQEPIPIIQHAIGEATLQRKGNIIFLAAAANSGGNSREMFPANMSDVISIRETNSHGAFSDTNPPVSEHDPAALGTLGRQVPAAWRSGCDGEVAKSGSSVATAVAAGIAAMVLGFVSKAVASPTEYMISREARKVQTHSGMRRVLIDMSQNMGNRSYFISPAGYFLRRDAKSTFMAIANCCSE